MNSRRTFLGLLIASPLAVLVHPFRFRRGGLLPNSPIPPFPVMCDFQRRVFFGKDKFLILGGRMTGKSEARRNAALYDKMAIGEWHG